VSFGEEYASMSMICELFIVPPKVARQVMTDPRGIHKLLESLEGSEWVVSLEKSWHGIHFTLTGTPWECDSPLNLLAGGGVPVGDEDVGYGPARLLEPAEVSKVDEALQAISEEEFARRFDTKALAKAEIYPQIWDEPVEDLKEEYGSYFQQMKQHVGRARQEGHALLITIR
jgi:hypothetical protein